jgi:hypothetical protein
LPWEDRSRLGFGNALVETVRLLVTRPGEAYARVRESGDYGSPILFAILLGWAGIIVNGIWNLAFQGLSLPFGSSQLPEGLAFLIGGGATVVWMVIAPIFIIIGLFIWSGLVHLSLMLIGGLDASQSGFEGTFRALSYTSVAQLAQVLPIFGSLITLVWSLVLGIIGLAALHRTSQGKAAAGMLIPMAFCCACIVVGIVLAISAGVMAGIAASQ